ncbi:MAG: amidohydrolase family protein [Thaumarchaeota archaeon]|nr:amidohydrolase family protein [Nitrososphaerota archaeon]
MPTIIDSHAHCSNRRDDALIPYAKKNGLRYDLSELLTKMRSNGVEAGLLLSPPLDDGSPLPNQAVMDLCEQSGGLLFPVLTVEPSREAVSLALALAKSHSNSVKGFKVRLGYLPVFADDPVFDPLYDHAIQEDLPVLFHAGDTATSSGSLVHAHPLTLDRLANRRSDLKIVVCHMGNPWIMDTAELVYKHANVYADLSGLVAGDSRYVKEYIDYLAAKISDAVYFAGGAEKLLFGTDYPVQTHENSLELVRRIKVERADADRILGSNAKRLFAL